MLCACFPQRRTLHNAGIRTDSASVGWGGGGGVLPSLVESPRLARERQMERDMSFQRQCSWSSTLDTYTRIAGTVSCVALRGSVLRRAAVYRSVSQCVAASVPVRVSR